MDARVVDQPGDALVPGPVLLAQELGELNEQLPTEDFVAVHVAHVFELRLHWRGNRDEGGRLEVTLTGGPCRRSRINLNVGAKRRAFKIQHNNSDHTNTGW